MFWVFQKKPHLSRKVQNSHKIKNVKKIISKKSATKVFQVFISIVYIALFWYLALALVLALHCYCGDNIKYGLLSKHLFQRKWQYGCWKTAVDSNDKLLEKITSSNYHMEQKTFIEASCIYNIHTGEKCFLQLLLWKVWESFRFGQIKKLEVCFGP